MYTSLVVYPSLDILFTLINDRLSPGRMSASLAPSDSWVKGSLVLVDVLSFVSSGRYTVLNDFLPLGKFMSSLMKCDVAPESITNFICFRLSIHRVHLVDLVCAIDCVVVMWLICSMSSSFSSVSSLSGAQ